MINQKCLCNPKGLANPANIHDPNCPKFPRIEAVSDLVNHPPHYTTHKSGVECITIAEHMNFCRGNALKYIWRAGEKDPAKELEDLKKARWYLDREIQRLEKAK